MNLKHVIPMGALVFTMTLPCAAGEQGPQACTEAAVEMASAFAKTVKLLPVAHEALVEASVCKPWPGKEPHTIGVFVWKGELEFHIHMLVTVFDAASGKVVASHQSAFEADALARYYQGSIRIDTARYQLQPGLRAFGVDIATQSPRYAEGGYGPLRTLYVRDGAALRPVLSDVMMSKWWYRDGLPEQGAKEEDDAVVYTTNYAIGIEKTSSRGYADLTLTSTSNDPKAKPVTRLLRYNGQDYPLVQD
jgi:hypothetical protein